LIGTDFRRFDLLKAPLDPIDPGARNSSIAKSAFLLAQTDKRR